MLEGSRKNADEHSAADDSLLILELDTRLELAGGVIANDQDAEANAFQCQNAQSNCGGSINGAGCYNTNCGS